MRACSSIARALRHPNPLSLHFSRVRAIDSAVQRSQSLPPVVMVHGVLASETTYRNILNRPDFVPNREKFAVDLRNHGKSPHVTIDQGMTYEQMSADLSSFLDDQRIDSACIIGHSMGGKVAMQLALSNPEKVSELIVVDIAPISYVPGKDSGDPFIATKAMRAVDLRTADTREKVDAQLLQHGLKSDTVRHFVMTNLILDSHPNAVQRYRWKPNLPAIEAAFPQIMSFPPHHGNPYTGPTCLIRGGKSKYVPFQSMKVFTSLFPNSKLVTISDAGHWLQSQTPDDFCSSVNDFLA